MFKLPSLCYFAVAVPGSISMVKWKQYSGQARITCRATIRGMEWQLWNRLRKEVMLKGKLELEDEWRVGRTNFSCQPYSFLFPLHFRGIKVHFFTYLCDKSLSSSSPSTTPDIFSSAQGQEFLRTLETLEMSMISFPGWRCQWK